MPDFLWYMRTRSLLSFFFFNDTATTEIYTLSLHDALPIYLGSQEQFSETYEPRGENAESAQRSEEHTSELQSRLHLVCRLLLEKKKNIYHLPIDVLRDLALANRTDRGRQPERTLLIDTLLC